MRGRGQEFHANSGAFIPGFAEEDDAALLFFLRFWVHEDQHFALINFVAQFQEPAVGADHLRFADFAEFPALMGAAEGLQTHLVEDALAAALRGLSQFGHGVMMAFPLEGGQLPFRTGVPTGQGPGFPLVS